MSFKLKTTAALVALAASSVTFAANTGGFATADGNIATARKFTAATYTEIAAIIAAARYNDAGTKVATGAYPLHIVYTGNEDALIANVVKGSTIDASHNCPAPHWSDAYRYFEIKNYTAGVTIEGANGSSANFGVVINGGSSNVVVKNMKIGALGGASNDADMFRIDSASNVLIDHNEMFAVNNECNGSPDGDLTFESAIDIKKASHNITVSYNFIHDSKKVGLDGSSASDIDGGRELTYHHNYYKNVNARLPLQRGGWIHVYNNFYDGITSSGVNVRTGGYALIEKNYFLNANNPVTCRYDTVNCGKWDLRGNNATSAADNANYNITWDDAGTGGINANTWATTAAFPKTLTYTYEPVAAACLKSELPKYAGVGKNGAVLTASSCLALSSSSSSAVSSVAVSSAAASSAAVSSVAASSKASASSSLAVSSASSAAAASSSKAAVSSSSAATSSASSLPVLKGTGAYPAGWSKCADLGGVCTVPSGDGWVAFGGKGTWVLKNVGVGKSIACTVAAFGSDPVGSSNKCSFYR